VASETPELDETMASHSPATSRQLLTRSGHVSTHSPSTAASAAVRTGGRRCCRRAGTSRRSTSPSSVRRPGCPNQPFGTSRGTSPGPVGQRQGSEEARRRSPPDGEIGESVGARKIRRRGWSARPAIDSSTSTWVSLCLGDPVSLREEQQNHAWFSYTTPFRTRGSSTYPASPSRHSCAFHHRLRPFPLGGYLAPL
jgi:hypothetical protein